MLKLHDDPANSLARHTDAIAKKAEGGRGGGKIKYMLTLGEMNRIGTNAR